MAVKYRYNLTRKIVDQIIQWLIIWDLAPEHYYLLTVQGRKTGRKRTHPVALVENGTQKWLVAPYGSVNWVLNARAAGQVTIRRGKSIENYSIEDVPLDERAPILKQYITLFAITRPYFDVKPSDPVEKFVPEAQWRPVFTLIGVSS